MSTATAPLQRRTWLRPKYLLFAFVGLMLAYVLRPNESFLVHPEKANNDNLLSPECLVACLRDEF
jgi:hypothetical protein